VDERLTRELERVEAQLHHLRHQLHDLPFDRRFRAVCLASLLHAVLYSAANHWPWGEPRLLPMTVIDTDAPFLPMTVFIYVSAYALVFVAFLSLRREESGRRFLEAFVLCVVSAGFFHWAWPTRYPRELFPLTEQADAFSRSMLGMVRHFDTPNSCLPSLHVATSVASAVLVRRERPKLFWALLAWAGLIIVSTLTTKQHYFVDVLSGTVLALVTTGLVDLFNARRARVHL
jgi:membrane-associated phospholipid phosphatase